MEKKIATKNNISADGKNYSFAEIIPDTVKENLKNYSELISQLLFARNITSAEDAEIFLNPSYERDVHDPYLLHDMDIAVERILSVVKENEHITIYGDYDCDGIPASVVLHDFFKKIKHKNFDVYIPDRHTEGYGLNTKALDTISKKGTSLLITVDLGISNASAVEYANSRGMDVIVTDHHLPKKNNKGKEELPPAFAILNPKKESDSYPYDMICGSGVAFKLVQALIIKINETENDITISEGWEKWLLDMVGLATLSDMVPLRGENRAFAFFGLKVMKKNRRLGLQKLFKKMYLFAPTISEDDVVFMVTPRINAASRMGTPRSAFELLAADNEVEAVELAKHLSSINDERKKLVTNIMRNVNKTLKKREEKEIIVIGDPEWRIGVVGLVAARLCENFNKPVFVWGKEGGDMIKGSCRSDGSVNVVTMMSKVDSTTLPEFGGHERAGGFSVSQDKIHFLEEELLHAYNKTKIDNVEKETVLIDRELTLDDVNIQNYRDIARLAPFGMDNPQPTFLFKGVMIDSVKTFGKEKNHLDLKFKKRNSETLRAIKFFADENSFGPPAGGSLSEGSVIDLIATMERSTFGGKTELRLRIVDIIG